MDNDVRAALRGDKEAAKRLTEKGVLVPCAGCGGENAKHRAVMAYVMIECPCGFMAVGYDLEEARRTWNTRAPILSESELKKLEEIL